jgi:hypothetical protein
MPTSGLVWWGRQGGGRGKRVEAPGDHHQQLGASFCSCCRWWRRLSEREREREEEDIHTYIRTDIQRVREREREKRKTYIHT